MGNQAASLKPEGISDLSSSTAFSPEELRKFYKEFMKECPPGQMTISLEGFRGAYARIFPKGDPSKFATHVFNHFDRDSSGRIDFREFAQALSVQLKGTMEDKLQWAFDLYDLDGTGYIEKSELFEMINSQYRLRGNTLPAEDKASPQQIVDFIMAKVDENKDNKLSREEFVEGAMSSKTVLRLLQGTLEATRSPFKT